jgi:hypothetical protein
VLHAKALPGNPYDRHSLAAAIDAAEKLTGCDRARLCRPLSNRVLHME